MGGNNRRVGVIDRIEGDDVVYKIGESGERRLHIDVVINRSNLTSGQIRKSVGAVIELERDPSNRIKSVLIGEGVA